MTEDQLEQQCLEWFAEDGWEIAHGPDIAHVVTSNDGNGRFTLFLVANQEGSEDVNLLDKDSLLSPSSFGHFLARDD